MHRLELALAGFACTVAGAETRASEAHFDGLVEGASAPALVEGGITFTNLDCGLPAGLYAFRVEAADLSLAGFAGFSPNNVVGFLGYSPGPYCAFTRCKSFEFGDGTIVTGASVEVFESGSYAGNTIALEAYLGPVLVATTSVTISGAPGVHHHALAVGGVAFDRARLVGLGAQDSGVFFGVVDDVVFGTAAAGIAYCAGDGSAAACPCGNASPLGADEGCLHSLGLGARLRGVGLTSLANDGLVLGGDQMPNAPALYFQGTQRFLSGAGAPFGDGLRCVGGAVIRLGIRQNQSGASQYPDVGDAAVSVRGLVTAPGTRDYQCWYRNSATFCTGGTYNLTNGLEIVWIP